MFHSASLHIYLMASLALCGTGIVFQADIRADSNRDGRVDLTGETDLKDKLEWSNTAGAIFLANIGDTDRRCSKIALQGPPLSNDALAACHDASDDIQRSPDYLAPLRTVPITHLDPDAWGTVSIHQEISRKNVRIFRREGKGWVITDNDHRFSQGDLERGLQLGIDARDTRRPFGWDGRVEVQFHVQNGRLHSDDYVRLRVAPVLTHHHLQLAEEFVVTAGNESVTPDQFNFVNDMRAAIEDTGVDKPIFLLEHSDDVWAQDILEPAYTSMPGPDGMVTLQVMIRSVQPSRVAGRQVFEYLRKTGRGAVYGFVGTRLEVNSMGNLETIPPYTWGGKSYPAGRVIEGAHGSVQPDIYGYIRAQELQDPLVLDVDWLAVGHVDEFVQFLRAKDSRHGWVLFIADPIGGIEILKKAERDGYGDTPAFSRKNATVIPPSPPDPYVPGYSISELLAKPDFVEKNYGFAQRIEKVQRVLQEETGVPDSDIYRLPSVFETGVCWGLDEGVLPERNCSDEHAAALYPGVINGLVLSDSQYLSPNPWGPVISGVDIMVEASNAVYGRIGYQVTYIDNWYSHHRDGGEVHCGTNSIRTVSEPWWREEGHLGKGPRHDEL
ncbi:hypothetical protein ETB97_007826 [Aspergillus alliaceus]|uniref:Protein-arginine deiminase C-terminal domain-containing protein n=1 Tax=Petromyces alliaceus TaxID=209559 RepID=A0A8H6E2G8_PETAA|nr:hypothetical protein ETB97_007826 [Aspergillus burnettii]